MLFPLTRAIAQLEDPVFVGVLWRSVLLSAAAVLLLGWGSAWGLTHALPAGWQAGWPGWVAGMAGTFAAILLAVWLFVPVAILVATLFVERVAAAVERRWYPGLPPARGAPLDAQLWDGVVLGVQVVAWQAVALILTPLLGAGLVLGLLVAAWAIGRGLFVAVAMRRMSRPAALALYVRRRPAVLAQGFLLALAGMVPFLNLIVPLLGIAAMVHLLDQEIGWVPDHGPGPPRLPAAGQ